MTFSRPGYVHWILGNPSTADENTDDPTVRRLIGFIERWGYRWMAVSNVNPFRATKPEMAQAPPRWAQIDNEFSLRCRVASASIIIAAWGAKAHPQLAKKIKHILSCHTKSNLYVMKLTKEGHPQHPLYLSNATEPRRWTP